MYGATIAAAKIGVKFGGCGISLPIAYSREIYKKDKIFSFVKMLIFFINKTFIPLHPICNNLEFLQLHL